MKRYTIEVQVQYYTDTVILRKEGDTAFLDVRALGFHVSKEVRETVMRKYRFGSQPRIQSIASNRLASLLVSVTMGPHEEARDERIRRAQEELGIECAEGGHWSEIDNMVIEFWFKIGEEYEVRFDEVVSREVVRVLQDELVSRASRMPVQEATARDTMMTALREVERLQPTPPSRGTEWRPTC